METNFQLQPAQALIAGVFFIGVLIPLVDRLPPPRDIFAARKAALLLVRGTMVGGAATLSRFVFAVRVPFVSFPLVIPLNLFASEDKPKGAELMPPAVLGLEAARESEGLDEPLV